MILYDTRMDFKSWRVEAAGFYKLG